MLTLKAVSRCPYCSNYVQAVRRASSVFSVKQVGSFTKNPEDKRTSSEVDLVSPPDPVSNIRQIVYTYAEPTAFERELHSKQLDTCKWNDKFWKAHNNNFFQEKKRFIENTDVISGSGKEVSDKLSIFYKEFLEKNKDVYLQYNKEWYERNFKLLLINLRASIWKMFHKSKT